MRPAPIRIIGIDPGLRRTGWGIVESDGVRLSYVASGLVTSDGDGTLAYRLRDLYEGLCGVLASFTSRNVRDSSSAAAPSLIPSGSSGTPQAPGKKRQISSIGQP